MKAKSTAEHLVRFGKEERYGVKKAPETFKWACTDPQSAVRESRAAAEAVIQRKSHIGTNKTQNARMRELAILIRSKRVGLPCGGFAKGRKS